MKTTEKLDAHVGQGQPPDAPALSATSDRRTHGPVAVNNAPNVLEAGQHGDRNVGQHPDTVTPPWRCGSAQTLTTTCRAASPTVRMWREVARILGVWEQLIEASEGRSSKFD